MSDRVICRSNHNYLGYPLAFYWQEQRLEVAEILAENHTPTGFTFRVRNEKQGVFDLIYDQDTDEWSVHQH